MSAKFIRIVTEIFITVFSVGFIFRFMRSIEALYEGRFGTLSWPVQASAIGERVDLGAAGFINFGDGTLTVSGQAVAHTLDLLFGLTTLAILICSFLVLRFLLLRFADGELVTEANTKALKKIGLLLLTACAISVLHAVILQPMILSAVTMPEGMILHPSISWNVQGMTNIWLHYDVPLFTFTLGGLALLFSEAFRAGTAYREDSESVV